MLRWCEKFACKLRTAHLLQLCLKYINTTFFLEFFVFSFLFCLFRRCAHRAGSTPSNFLISATFPPWPGDQELQPLHAQINKREPGSNRTWSAITTVQIAASRDRHGETIRCVAVHETYVTKTLTVDVKLDVKCKYRSSPCCEFMQIVLVAAGVAPISVVCCICYMFHVAYFGLLKTIGLDIWQKSRYGSRTLWAPVTASAHAVQYWMQIGYAKSTLMANTMSQGIARLNTFSYNSTSTMWDSYNDNNQRPKTNNKCSLAFQAATVFVVSPAVGPTTKPDRSSCASG